MGRLLAPVCICRTTMWAMKLAACSCCGLWCSMLLSCPIYHQPEQPACGFVPICAVSLRPLHSPRGAALQRWGTCRQHHPFAGTCCAVGAQLPSLTPGACAHHMEAGTRVATCIFPNRAAVKCTSSHHLCSLQGDRELHWAQEWGCNLLHERRLPAALHAAIYQEAASGCAG